MWMIKALKPVSIFLIVFYNLSVDVNVISNMFQRNYIFVIILQQLLQIYRAVREFRPI